MLYGSFLINVDLAKITPHPQKRVKLGLTISNTEQIPYYLLIFQKIISLLMKLSQVSFMSLSTFGPRIHHKAFFQAGSYQVNDLFDLQDISHGERGLSYQKHRETSKFLTLGWQKKHFRKHKWQVTRSHLHYLLLVLDRSVLYRFRKLESQTGQLESQTGQLES